MAQRDISIKKNMKKPFRTSKTIISKWNKELISQMKASATFQSNVKGTTFLTTPAYKLDNKRLRNLSIMNKSHLLDSVEQPLIAQSPRSLNASVIVDKPVERSERKPIPNPLLDQA